MRKFILLAAVAAIAFPSAAMAQRHHDRDRHRDRVEVRHDKRETRQDRRELHRDRRQGDVRDVRHDRRELRGDRRELRHDRRDVRYDRRDYRNDRNNHHDYRDYHNNYRSHVRYVAPYRNWSYRPVRIGFRLDPVFYSSRYYINDYGYYGLRAPRPWERWIRYGDDLLLVDLRSGMVVNVIHYGYW
ncbi:MAG TPA: RcnB family protein [Sphingomicrobium sp.]|jgi:Ni/Co efflux regulator RcnB